MFRGRVVPSEAKPSLDSSLVILQRPSLAIEAEEESSSPSSPPHLLEEPLLWGIAVRSRRAESRLFPTEDLFTSQV